MSLLNSGPIVDVAAIIAISTSAIAGFISAFLPRKDREKVSKNTENINSSIERDCRLFEVQAELRRQKVISKWQGVAATSLTFSQYIVGGVLTTSFIQDNLSSQVVGLLGLLVLVSSLIHQQFRPDLKSRFAKERIVTLRGLIRAIEDDLFAIRQGTLNQESLHDIRVKVTNSLKDIETSELQDLGKIDSESST
ncbi:hypothetical protein [Photobacterium marinum]|uniref:hypothetical protein n=1 Tax=Photobacterium marinum TaxID=1056511 RepID=UPI0012F845B1|nr:hypothetical protein [Photobacterium marinum]